MGVRIKGRKELSDEEMLGLWYTRIDSLLDLKCDSTKYQLVIDKELDYANNQLQKWKK